MLTLDQVREKLADRRVQVVAKATGLHFQTVYEVMKPGANPTYKTVKAISDYLTASQ